jgi:hypothetical protein
VVDYELLLRTSAYEVYVGETRRHSYLDDVRDRYIATPLPSHLRTQENFGVPYVHGHVESTGGMLWVVGRNARLFDFFLPERWRRTPSWKLSENNEVCYTLTKDHVHIVWKTSRVGEAPPVYAEKARTALARLNGFNSPFEECAIAQDLNAKGIPTVYIRAVYMAGSQKVERSADARRYRSHRRLLDIDGEPILRREHNYITIRGYYNGSDAWVASQQGQLCRPMDLRQALAKDVIPQPEHDALYRGMLARLQAAGYDGTLLDDNDMLIATMPDGAVERNAAGEIELRICNLELMARL